MRVKALGIFVITAAFLLTLGDLSWAGGRIAHRQRDQQRRIAHGVRSGQMTNQEFIRLNRKQWRIQSFKRRARAEGYLSEGERRHLRRLEKKASRHIYGAKHNRVAYRPYRKSYKSLHFRHHPGYYRYYLGTSFYQPGWFVEWSVGNW